ncbi:putative NAD-dependent malic enzyme 4 [Alicyclobacillus acidoterrestris]|uniref:NAD(P)-dependent malic enzyme n=1 Tax=Alicyclobacillus suci TaxID=2816080 RepID=UPI00119218AB|nr:malic enzyme-like NAD(P)-binding protein [Alicyclobacillus suci]GEO26536.1 putative NAD-dependent malic enzyme 4 [Alicyclobacillus acidoterrestris]
MSLKEEALELHRLHVGKLAVTPKMNVETERDLSLAYSPGVAEPCKEIQRNAEMSYEYTGKGNTIAIVTNGTAVLGLGNIGAAAALPVMEGKAVLFKRFAGVDAFPICINSEDPDEVVRTVKLLESQFGGVNLEDIAAPTCFEIEQRLIEETNIPIFHDDQHGTAIVTAAALMNALKLAGKAVDSVRVVVNGAGAAGVATVDLLLSMGIHDIVLCDTRGAIYAGRSEGMNPMKEALAKRTNIFKLRGSLAEVIVDADVFIGVSVADALTPEMVQAMAPDRIIFAMANPDPEILPEVARDLGVLVIGTGRSDYPNQVNNVLAFPGVFRGVLDVRASRITLGMKAAAANAIANLVSESELRPDYVIPKPFHAQVAPSVAEAVAQAAIAEGVARRMVRPQEVFERTTSLVRV